MQHMPLLHAWALEQATEFIADGMEDVDVARLKVFTENFCKRTRQALRDSEHASEDSLAQMGANMQAFRKL